jgi:ABC-type bacteriocin/lantibiotic exporter with double-glycine peptidase domain
MRTTFWILRQIRPFWRVYGLAHACLLMASIVFVFNPLIMKFLIDGVIAGQQMRLVPLVVLGFVIAFILNQILVALAGFSTYAVSRKVVFRIRIRALRNLQACPAEIHERASVGDRLYRLEHDVEQIGSLLGETIPEAFRILLVLLFIQLVMFRLNLQLALVVLTLIPLFLLLVRAYRSRLRCASERVNDQQSLVNGFLQEHLSALVQISLLCAELRQVRQFARLAGRAEQLQVARKITEQSFTLLISFVVMLGVISVLALGAHQAISGRLSTGGLVAFYSYTLQVFGPLCGAVDLYSRLERIGTSVQRVVALGAVPEVMRDGGKGLCSTSNGGNIEMADVSFHYPQSRNLLSAVSLQIPAGEKVALVGANGCGKSTLVKLIARLHDVRSGSVRIGGVDIREIRLKSLRQNIGYIPQEPVLFDASLRDNLLLGNPYATKRELDRVAEITLMETLLRKLPGSWEGSVGRLGCNLSGGERQRVALARCLLQRASILLLDECTSALDEAAEERILKAVAEFRAGATIVIVSHRVSARVWADRIVRIDSGGIIAEELSHTPSVYYRDERASRNLDRSLVASEY